MDLKKNMNKYISNYTIYTFASFKKAVVVGNRSATSRNWSPVCCSIRGISYAGVWIKFKYIK